MTDMEILWWLGLAELVTVVPIGVYYQLNKASMPAQRRKALVLLTVGVFCLIWIIGAITSTLLLT